MFDPFRNLTDEEIKKKLNDWWEDLPYLKKIEILLRVYEKLNITKIESLGINSLWRKISLERKKDLNIDNWQY